MLRRKYMVIWLIIAVLLPLMGFAKSDKDEWDVDIPFKKYVLDNGLTLIVHEDHKAPIVAVNIWYHVGSKNEKPGKTGFAHLFEHLMFNGSEHFNDDYFQALERLGATDLNGTTNRDRTNYFQNVPKNWMWFYGWNPIEWGICWVPLTRPSWMNNAVWCKMKSARVKTGPTDGFAMCWRKIPIPKDIRIRGQLLVPWRT